MLIFWTNLSSIIWLNLMRDFVKHIFSTAVGYENFNKNFLLSGNKGTSKKQDLIENLKEYSKHF
jgi:hypothetical protein